MSTRWSYGPEGLRERPAARWSEGGALPRWRDVQPLLIRSAGIVGIVATIMTVVASDAFRSAEDGPDRNAAGEAGPPAKAAPAVAVSIPVDLRAAEPAPAAVAAFGGSIPPLAPSVEASGPDAAFVATIEPPQHVRQAAAPAPDAVGAMPAPVPRASAVTAASGSAAPAPAAPDLPLLADLRHAAGVSAGGAEDPVTTASVHPGPASQGMPPDAAPPAASSSSANLPIAELRAPEEAAVAAAPAVPDSSAVPAAPAASAPAAVERALPGGSDCRRDWIAPQGGQSDGPLSSGCEATLALIEPVDDGARSALEAAAAEHAAVLASLPRVPQARPELPPDFQLEEPRPRRVSARRADWPDEPPPNCGSGKHAKWRFVDRGAGSKEWYCR